MAQQTAVEWLQEKFNNYDISTGKAYFRKLLNEAKQMEKEQIERAYQWDRFPCSDEEAEQYYNETFNNK